MVSEDEVDRPVEGALEEAKVALYVWCLTGIAGERKVVSLSGSQNCAESLSLLIAEEVEVQIREPSEAGHRAVIIALFEQIF